MSSSDLGCCALDDCDLLSLFLDDNLPQLAPDPPCDSTSTSPQGTKRRFNDNEQLGESSMHEVVVSRKRPRGDGNFSCPYRRRNPRVFNVRDFPTCAQNSFSSITLVKRHVMAAHQAKDFNTQCETCSAWFRTEKALNSHINNRSCSNLLFPAVDEHDKGITDDIENKLRDRRSRTKVLNWDDLWRTIFPSSQVIGSSGKKISSKGGCGTEADGSSQTLCLFVNMAKRESSSVEGQHRAAGFHGTRNI